MAHGYWKRWGGSIKQLMAGFGEYIPADSLNQIVISLDYDLCRDYSYVSSGMAGDNEYIV